MEIPQDCVGYITGSRRAALSGMEADWGVYTFFMGDKRSKDKEEKLVIFGPERDRRGCELKVMSSVETKSPGYFARGIREKESDRKGFGTDRMILRSEDVSYALGKEGTTRKKLQAASGRSCSTLGMWPSSPGTSSSGRAGATISTGS